MDKRAFFFSLLAFFLVIMIFFYFKSSIEVRNKELSAETEKYRFHQYNNFFKESKTKYVPLQMRFVTKSALVNISRNSSFQLMNLSSNLSEAVIYGTIDGVEVLNDNMTFIRAISRIHQNWMFQNTFQYDLLEYSIRHRDWQNLTLSYRMRMVLEAPGYSFEDILDHSVTISSLGINTSLGIIAPGWNENNTEPCVLRRLSPAYDCLGISGSSPS